MAFKCLYQLALLHSPQLQGGISAARNQVCGVTRKPAIPNPLQVTLKLFILTNLKLMWIYNLEELNFLVSRASAQEFTIGGNLDLQDVVVVCLDGFALAQVFSLLHIKGLNEPSIVSKGNILSILADRDGSDTNLIIAEDGDSLFLVSYIPKSEEASLISRENFDIIGMHDCTIDWSVLLEGANLGLFSEVKDPEKSIFTTCVDNLVMFPEPHCSYIALEINIERPFDSVAAGEVVYSTSVIHSYNKSLLVVRDFDPVGDEIKLGQFDFFAGNVGSSARIPEFDGTIV